MGIGRFIAPAAPTECCVGHVFLMRLEPTFSQGSKEVIIWVQVFSSPLKKTGSSSFIGIHR
eukprot:5433802-Pyramimonas_sp.AAC.1